MSLCDSLRADSCRWIEYFGQSALLPPLPWEDPYHLTAAERAAVARSLQQFQLGEGAQGRGFLRRAEGYARRSSDREFITALRLFIAEEQRHSADLGRFLQQEGIPLLQAQWVDSAFRRLRKLAGLEVCAGVLVTAELLAMPYYLALLRATQSPLLRALCSRILRDEAAHLRFQAATLARLRVARARPLRSLAFVLHRAFFLITSAVVWWQHRPVLQRGGLSLNHYFAECVRRFAAFQRETEAARNRLLTRQVPAALAHHGSGLHRALEVSPRHRL